MRVKCQTNNQTVKQMFLGDATKMAGLVLFKFNCRLVVSYRAFFFTPVHEASVENKLKMVVKKKKKKKTQILRGKKY